MIKLIARSAAALCMALIMLGASTAPSASAQTDDVGDTATTDEVCFVDETTIQRVDRIEEFEIVTDALPPYVPGSVRIDRQVIEAVEPVTSQVEVPCDPDEVLGISIDAPPLALTGSNVKLPIVIAFSMIGVGGVALSEARRRQDHLS